MPVSLQVLTLHLLVIPVLVSGCTSGDAPAHPEQETAVATKQRGPQVGRCHRLSAADLKRRLDEGPAVACQDRHAGETFAVIDLVDVPSHRRLRTAETRCAERFPIYTGGQREDSVIDWVALRSPTKGDDSGSVWWRCDAFVSAKPFEQVPRAYVGSVAGTLRPAVPIALRRCTDRTWSRFVPCARPHRVEQIARSLVLGRPAEAFLSRRLYVETVKPYCSRANDRYHRQHPRTDVETMYRWPTRKGWRQGFRNGSCWASAERGTLPSVRSELR